VRFITKTLPDRFLVQRNQTPPTTQTEATNAWGNFRQSKHTRDKCIQEQFGLCGYSEVDLSNDTPILDLASEEISRCLGTHLEHVEPKSRNPQRTFDHNNLIASVIDDIKYRGLVKADVFGGHAKLKWYNEDSFIHPLLHNCRDYFHYETTGLIVPKLGFSRRERAKVRLTIYKLNLNAPLLIVWRRNWLSQMDLLINELLGHADALKSLAELELLPSNQKLRPFHSGQRQLFGTLGRQVIEESGEII